MPKESYVTGPDYTSPDGLPEIHEIEEEYDEYEDYDYEQCDHE